MPASQIFHTEGRRVYNQIFNGTITRPASVWVGLRICDGAGGRPADAAAGDTLSSNLSEVGAGVGYARAEIVNNTTNVPETAVGADSRLTYAQQTFTFTGTVSSITHAFICTSSDATGKLLASAPLSVARNVANGDTLKITFQFDLTQG
jgi:hypothetical protein